MGSASGSLNSEAPEVVAAGMEDDSETDLAQADEEAIFSIDELDEAPEEQAPEVEAPRDDQGDLSEPLDERADEGEFELEFDSGDEREIETEESDASPMAEDDLDLSELEALEAAEDGRNAANAVGETKLDNAGMDPSPLDEDMGDFDFGADGETDINATKIDLAEAYIDMGDGDGARDILNEVLEEGSPEQKSRAQELLDGID